MTQNSILQWMLKNTIAKNKATIPVVPTKTQWTNNNIVFGGVPATENTVVPTQPTPQVKVANPITQPASNVQLQQNIYWTPKPTVATAQNPVREIWVPKPVVTPPATVQYDPSIYDQYNNYSKTDIQNWLDHATVLASQGQPLSTQDQLIARNFQRKLEEMNKPQDIVDPTKALIEQTNADKEARRLALESQANTLYTSEEERLRKYYEQRKQDTLAWAERTKQAGQAATSFSWFGRSTFNADQQTQIQKESEQAIAIDQAEMQTALDRYNAQLQGATQEQLAQYDNRIAELQGKSLEFKQQQYEAINAYNAQTAQDMSTKLENLVTLAQQNVPQTPLTDAEKQQASAYASLIIGSDGKVDTALMKEIPPRLISEAVTQGAMMKKAITPEQEKFWFVNVGDWVIARTNPNTWDVEYTRSWFAQNKAPETVKTENWTFQYNQTTWNYDIPVGGTWWATGDLRWLASQYPWQAWAKNNNPAGITWNANFDNLQGTAKLLSDAGIRFGKGTARPPAEGGNYVTFPTIEEWLAAQRVMYTQTYWNSTVGDMLRKRVGTGEANNYAKQLSWSAWIDMNAKVNQLSDQQLSVLQNVQIGKESPWLARLMKQETKVTPAQWWYEPQTAEEEQLLASVSQSKGKKVLPAWTVSMLSDGRWLPNLVSDLDKLVNDNTWKFWPVAGRIAWWNEYDTQGQNIQSKLKLVSQIVGKFMEWWVLRKEDEVKYEKMLPTLKDSPEVAKSKIENVKSILEQKYKWYIQDYSNNYDVSWFPIKLFWETPQQWQQNSTPVAQQEQLPQDEEAEFASYMNIK